MYKRFSSFFKLKEKFLHIGWIDFYDDTGLKVLNGPIGKEN